jgi:hypothetical protein
LINVAGKSTSLDICVPTSLVKLERLLGKYQPAVRLQIHPILIFFNHALEIDFERCARRAPTAGA